MLRATLRSLLSRKLRLLLSALAVVLGVSFVSGAFVLTDTLGKVFDDLFSRIDDKTAVQVQGEELFAGDGGSQRSPVPASLLTALERVDGVAAATGDVTGYAQVVKRTGKAYSTNAPALGQNWDPSPATSPYTLRSGAGPVRPDEVALDATTASKTDFRPGDRVRLLLPVGQRTFTVSGVFGFGDSDNLGGASIAAFAPDTARALLAKPGELEVVRLAAEPGVDEAALRDRVAKVLPPGVEALTGDAAAAQSADEIKGFFGFFQTFLLLFAGVALFVGAFLIFNTFTILVAQRQRELALLRALGASRGQVTVSVLVEALLVGLVASVLGLASGIGVAKGLQALISSFGGDLPSGPLLVQTRTVVVSLVTGLLVTVLAALLPARRAAAVPPVAAMRDAVAPEHSLRRGTVVGAVLLVAGAVLLAVGLQGSLALVGLGALVSFLGVAGLSPQLARPVARLLGAPLARAVPGRLGRLNAMRNPRRTAATAAALMIGMALVTAVGVVGASAKASVEKIVQDAVAADVVVQTSGFQGLPAAVAEVVAKAPGVATVDHVRADQGRVGGRTVPVTALDDAAVGRSVRLTRVAGRLDLRPGTLLLSKGEATRRSLAPGDTVAVTLARGGEQRLTVGGTYEDNQLVGGVLLDASAAADFATTADAALLVRAAPGTSTAALVRAVDTATLAYPTAQVLDQSAFIEDTTSRIDVVISIISVLLALSVLIAVLGIVNTLALAVLERTRELGLLRAVGLGRRQTRRMVTVEAVIVALFGALLGIAVGSVFGVALQRALADDGVSELRFPVGRLVLFLVVAGIAGVLAALLPARRAARLDVLQAIASA
ncbi:MAG: putative transport system integral rane protein [Frankiales bacterium]|nr:putative transport system integral rane protein [Frankiales bacterium]